MKIAPKVRPLVYDAKENISGKLKSLPEIIIDESIYKKIVKLCRNISNVEWSGVLLYTVQGSIRNPEEMKILIKDIIPMDMGSTAYTSFKFNENGQDLHIDYCLENPEALQWKVGLIHSHNHMAVFFSGTDMEELEEAAQSHNFYVSLIVNNRLDMTAKIGYKAVAKGEVEVDWKASDENGELYSVNSESLKIDRIKFISVDCAITVPVELEVEEDDFFSRALNKIMRKEPSNNQTNTERMFSFNTVPAPEDIIENDLNFWTEDMTIDFISEVIMVLDRTYRFLNDSRTILESARGDRKLLDRVPNLNSHNLENCISEVIDASYGYEALSLMGIGDGSLIGQALVSIKKHLKTIPMSSVLEIPFTKLIDNALKTYL